MTALWMCRDAFELALNEQIRLCQAADAILRKLSRF